MIGDVVKANRKTVWVKVQFKKKVMETIEEKIKEILKPYDRIIKRHMKKHTVEFMGE